VAIPKKIKDKLLVEAKHACVICGASRVQIHHIDGNKENNHESNLIVLCLKHHDEAEKSKKGRSTTANITQEQLRRYKAKQKQEWIYHRRMKEEVEGGLILPVPPAPYFAHPYPMQKNFTGRMAERKELTEWFIKRPEPMFAYVAIGGMGKSALTWYWMHEDIIKQGLAPEGIIWWSFYDKEARFETFLMKAIQYTSKGKIDPKTIDSNWERMHTLKTLLYDNKLLLILDGVERVLRAYAGLGSPYQGDDVKEDERQDFRRCVDPNVATFLQWLAGSRQTKTLITSRLCPEELDDKDGCFCKYLTKMNKEDAVEFFHHQGVKGTRAEIENAGDPFGYHPLCLRLLSGMIIKDPKFMGDVNAWTKQDPLSGLTPREHPILELAYNSLDQKKKTLISKLSAFRNPMDYQTLSILNEFTSQEKFDNALNELLDRGMLLCDDKTNRYDLHPIVRSSCYDKLLDKEGVHSKLRDYFADVPQPEKVESLDDLAPVIELYHHTVNSERYDEAFNLFYERISKSTYYQFGAYNLRIQLLRALFPDGEGKPPRLKEEIDQGWTLNALANSYSLSGQPKKAVLLFEMQNKLREAAGDKENLVIGLSNLALIAQIPLGELKSAESNLRRSIKLSQEIKNQFQEAIGHEELGRLLAYQGMFEESERELAQSTTFWKKQNFYYGLCLDESYRCICALLAGKPIEALYAAKNAKKFAAMGGHLGELERNSILAESLLGAAYLAKGELVEAEKHLEEALKRDRKINLVELEPDILLELAKLRFKQEHSAIGRSLSADRRGASGGKEEALKVANEALQIANRCEYRLKQADVNNFLAEFYLDKKDYKTAKEHADIAKERAECGYKPALDKAKKLIKLIKEKIAMTNEE